jgi:hypothetical protein
MTLAEQLMLLAMDPVRGRFAAGIVPARLRRGTAGAILAELVLHHRLLAFGDRVALADTLPDYQPLLGEAVPLLARGGAPLSIAEALDRIERGIGGLVARVREALVSRDLLHHYRQAFFIHTYPLRSRQAADTVFATLHRVIEAKGASLADHALAALADASGAAAATLPSEKQFLLRRALHADEGVVASTEFALIRAIAREIEGG